MTSQNIDKFLDGQQDFLGAMALLFMVFIVVLIVLLKDKPEILEKVLYSMGGLIVGAFGGYGFGKSKKD